LYEEFDNKGHIPLRNLIYKKIDYLSTISKHGENYLKNKYPFTSSKVRTHYLGVTSQVDKLSYLKLRSPINIVSCGWVGQRKNVLGIYDLLKNEANMKWTHLGGGDQLQYLVDRVESEVINLEVILPGEMCNDDILDYYKNNAIDCFLSLSTNEGLPVSMMEAMAHGIPVVSTDVGGCAEIVNENTGVLLPKNYTDEDVRNAVYLCAEKFKSPESRQRIQNFIKENFDAEKNYGKFVDFLEQANKEHHSKLEND
jgi:glycosyltransferase involved in cell wall biosynthesis